MLRILQACFLVSVAGQDVNVVGAGCQSSERGVGISRFLILTVSTFLFDEILSDEDIILNIWCREKVNL
jgi:hypothetical protein